MLFGLIIQEGVMSTRTSAYKATIDQMLLIKLPYLLELSTALNKHRSHNVVLIREIPHN